MASLLEDPPFHVTSTTEPLGNLGNNPYHRDAPAHAPHGGADAVDPVSACLQRAADYSFKHMHPDFHWCAELRSNPTVTAEYVLMLQALQLPMEKEPLRRWLLGEQNPDGSYGVAVGEPGDVSTTAEVYLALKLLGVEERSPEMQSARAYVLAQGGIAKVRVFTRLFFALFGLFPWKAVPQMPAEFILMPSWVPVNIYKLASWARGTIVPFLILLHHRPVYALPNGTHANNDYLDELWVDASNKNVPYMPSLQALWNQHGPSWAFFFGLTDTVCRKLGGLRRSPVRRMARKKCVQWILDRQEPTGDWAGIFPPMLNNLLALPLEGYAMDSDPMQRGLAAMEAFAWRDERGKRIQACISPVWDTLLTSIGLCDASMPTQDERLEGAAAWLTQRQLLGPEGDWRVYRPNLRPGGWAFEYDNNWYPDVDDTAAVILALVKQNPASATTECVHSAVEWILGMQNRDGGWGAFDVDNDKLFLNDIPFADMGALCDPSTPDVTGRILEAFGLLMQCSKGIPGVFPGDMYRRVEDATQRGLAYVLCAQEAHGGWWGRWGVNYLYGTSNVLCGLGRLEHGVPRKAVRRACAWIQSVQQADGGWGEHLGTYFDSKLAGQGTPTASQTAWALMALLTYHPPEHPAIVRGVHWLMTHQNDDGTWDEPQTTATGFPQHFYVRYDMYRHYFPLMALGRFARQRGFSALSALPSPT